jgi:hypothetical protein
MALTEMLAGLGGPRGELVYAALVTFLLSPSLLPLLLMVPSASSLLLFYLLHLYSVNTLHGTSSKAHPPTDSSTAHLTAINTEPSHAVWHGDPGLQIPHDTRACYLVSTD